MEANATRHSILRWWTSYHCAFVNTFTIKYIFHANNCCLFPFLNITNFGVLLQKHNGILWSSLRRSYRNQESGHNLIYTLSILIKHEHGCCSAHSLRWNSSLFKHIYIALWFLVCDRCWNLRWGWGSHVRLLFDFRHTWSNWL